MYSSQSISHLHPQHAVYPMMIVMIISGLLSSMYIWADKYDDVRISLNDIYMTFLMTGWMFLLTGIYYQINRQILIGTLFVGVSFLMIRWQSNISTSQYIKGMIPHHSMAVMMSKRLLENNYYRNKNDGSIISRLDQKPELKNLIENIIRNQEAEIELLKRFELEGL